jgi:DNA-binding NarL/FixJ family response regulator
MPSVPAVPGMERVTRQKLQLTPREQQILRLVVQGCTNAEIAERLGLEVQTVKNRLCELYSKTGVSNRVALALFGLKHGFS